MWNRLFSGMVLAALTAGLAGCGGSEPAKPAEEPAKTEAKPAPVEGPWYEVTKEEITSHAGFTSRNVTVMGIKLGDKTTEVAEKNLGPQLGKTNVLQDEYQTYYQSNGVSVFTFKLTG